MATLASYALYLAVQEMPVREVEVNSIPVVVANQDLPVGTLLTVDHVKVVAWPQASPVPGAFGTIEEVTDRGLIAGVVTNEPLTDSKLASREAGGGLPPSIPLGMRALSVRVNEVIGVAGFVVPGTRVDVLATVQQGNQGESISKVVVSNVQAQDRAQAAGHRAAAEHSRRRQAGRRSSEEIHGRGNPGRTTRKRRSSIGAPQPYETKQWHIHLRHVHHS